MSQSPMPQVSELTRKVNHVCVSPDCLPGVFHLRTHGPGVQRLKCSSGSTDRFDLLVDCVAAL